MRGCCLNGRYALIPSRPPHAVRKCHRDEAQQIEVLRLLSEKYTPGRWDHIKPPSKSELTATGVVRIPLVEVSAKIRTGGPSDDAEDYSNPAYWAGLIPLKQYSLPAIPDPKLLPGIPIPQHVKEFAAVPPLPKYK